MRIHILLSATFVLFLGATKVAQAQTVRACESYISASVAADILGQRVPQSPGNGQFGKEQNLEWHSCEWIGYYPPVAPGAPQNPASLSVSLQRYSTVELMRKSQLSPQELGPKVRFERVAKFGDLGGFYTNGERNVVTAVGSKGAKTVTVSVDMGFNPIRSNARRSIESILEKLWTEL